MDRSYRIFAISVLLLPLSYVVDVLSVHTYCEERIYAVIVGIAALVNFGLVIWSRATNWKRKVASGLAGAFSIVVIASNAAFVIWATRDCRHMFDQLH